MVLWWALAVAAVAVLGGCVWRASANWRSRRRYRTSLLVGRQMFRRRREWLEAEFLSLASASGRSRDLAWAHCDFANEVAFARDRHTGQLRALVGITLGLEAAVGDEVLSRFGATKAVRVATAVFRFDGQRWSSDGRAIFNLSPNEAIRRLRNELELVD